MGDETEETEVEETETETEADDVEREVVLDLESAEEYEQQIDELTETVEEQQAEIEELQDMLLDLSVRSADDRGMGVCPECHGPVEKVRRWFRPTVIKCRRCEEVFHEY